MAGGGGGGGDVGMERDTVYDCVLIDTRNSDYCGWHWLHVGGDATVCSNKTD